MQKYARSCSMLRASNLRACVPSAPADGDFFVGHVSSKREELRRVPVLADEGAAALLRPDVGLPGVLSIICISIHA